MQSSVSQDCRWLRAAIGVLAENGKTATSRGRNAMTGPPFQVGDRVDPGQLVSWVYTGLSGKPGKDKDAVRRYKKGIWVLEIRAHELASRTSRVVSIRNSEEDEIYWRETRLKR